MINLSKSGDTIVFEFVNNGHYLENGTIEVPVNSLSLVIDSSNMATFKKASSNDVFIAATYDELGMTKAELETFYKENMAGSTGGGGGATYSAGLGIEIDSADTITAIYEGYPQVDDEAKTIRLSNTTDPFYVMSTNDVSTSGATRFKFGSKNRNAIYDFAQHTATIDGEEWPDYLTWQWSDSYNMFYITPLQSIPAATASTGSGTTFVMPSGVTLVNSGKTTSVINDLTNKVDNIPFNTQISLNGEQVYLSYKKADGITYGSGFNVGGGLTNDNGALSTKVRKSNQAKWVDVAIGGNNNVYFDATTTVQFDLTDVPEAEVYVRTNNCESEQILDENGDVITGQTCITVTKSDNHVVVTAVDNPYAETPNSISGIEGSQSFRWYMENLQIWGYEYTTIDDSVENILSGKQDTLSAGTGIEISGNVISATGGGGGIDSGTVQTMIDDSISGKADTSAVTESINAAVSGKVDTTDFATYSGTVETALSGKVDTSAITSSVTSASTDSQVPSAKAVYDAISAGGSSVNVVQTTGTSTTDVMSQNAVTTNLQTKLHEVRVDPKTPTSNYTQLNLYSGKGNGGAQSLFTYVRTINGKSITSQDNKNLEGFSLIEASAITSSVTSASTDSQVPSAKAVYDAISTGGGGTVSSAITSGDTNAVAGGAVYDKFDEVESVTARALIDVNEKFGGLKLVKITQAQYDALSPNYDNNTLYVII